MQGSLFTQDFLCEGITETAAWRETDEAELAVFHDRLIQLFDSFPVGGAPNEATTERNLIDHVLRALGWDHFLVQQAVGRGRSDVPDYLLIGDTDSFERANAEREDSLRYPHGIAIVEAKRWQRPLDRGPGREPDLFDDGVPSTQMLRYLSRAEVASERRIQWGILTNGRHWRLYYQGARSRSEEFLELDLPLLLDMPGVQPDLFSPAPELRQHLLRVFKLMFGREAFEPVQEGGRTFHQLALDEGRHWEARVADDLSSVVFEDVFPKLIRALASHDPDAPTPLTDDYLEQARVAALTLLYRVLFVLYAEDRNLLPVRDRRYDDYALRRIRENARDRIDARDVFSRTQGRYYDEARQLFLALNEGDESLGLPPYNGGLFNPRQQPILNRVTIPDADFAPVLDALSRRQENNGTRKWINYRDLSVQQLGSIYERLLEYDAVLAPDGGISVQPSIFARRLSGSYYTHQDLVDLIIRRTIGPLLEERRANFYEKVTELRSARRRKLDRLAELEKYDPASAFLGLKICDPAMGSGHFLVSLVDYLADNILETVAEAEAAVDWADADAPYRSPLGARISNIRDRILSLAAEQGWAIVQDQLDDRQIVRRMILKRSIFGVDKNPMAVELAKVSLWLHTFTVGAPLSFLDHHLRCGDSLYGEWVAPAMRELSERYGLLINPYVQQAKNAASGMRHIETMTDADVVEVQESATTFEGIAADTEPLARFLDFRHALRWSGHNDLGGRTQPRELVPILDGSFGDPFRVVNGDIPLILGAEEDAETPDMFEGGGPEQLDLAPQRRVERATRLAAQALLDGTREIASRERFLHWEVAYPGVWSEWESAEHIGGFDAVIGNPPWDRIKLQEVEWFAVRRPEIAHAARASDRRRMVAALKEAGTSLWAEYELARDRAAAMATVARKSGQYPLLGGGDINIYSLFVERAHALVKPEGIVGLLVPSGIASDLSASAFFRRIATSGRLAALFDFENKRIFFPDVHASFKFSVYVAGGKQRSFPVADCAFYLHAVDELADPESAFSLTARDFAEVNPNTGTAPVFRSRRDAELTTAVYGRAPVLMDRRTTPPSAVWRMRYFTMYHMTNDAGRFKRISELETEGFYRVNGGCFRRGAEEYVPLYEGKMVQAYDHRAASVIVNPENLNRPAQPVPADAEQHADPDWVPEPQFWVARREVARELTAATYDGDGSERERISVAPRWFLGFKDVTAPTNVRTMIAAIIPEAAVGNTFPLLLPALPSVPGPHAPAEQWQEFRDAFSENVSSYIVFAPLLTANLNCLAYDYLARQKVHGQHLNFFIVEQLPVIVPDLYDRLFGGVQAANLVKREVLRLTYTSRDIQPFARDQGFDGPPFAWDAEDRRHRRARLDALFFHLYEIGRDDAAYIIDSFPILKRDDEAAFGRYMTKDLILAYMNALAAGDTETVISL